MDMYEITLNVMYTASVLVAMFTGILIMINGEYMSRLFTKLNVYGWLMSAAAFVAALITLIWVK